MSTAQQQPVVQVSVARPRVRISGFIITVQAILFLVHWFVYETWVSFWAESDRGVTILRTSAFLLSISFVIASLLAYRHWNVWVRVFYRIAAMWLGFLNLFFVAACLSWVTYLGARIFTSHVPQAGIAATTFGLAVLAGIYGFLNARWPRVKKIAISLANLPPSWRGRVAALVCDVHLGHVNGAGFMRRIVAKLKRLNPHVVFVPGDLYDGTSADLDALAAPWKGFSPPFGIYFVTGNHEEFSDRTKYLKAVARHGIRVLNNEKVSLENLQIIGVHDRDASDAERFRSILESAGVDRRHASILLAHIPHKLAIAEKAGISLQLSGHTHGGQMFPFTWFTRRIFLEYTYGLNRFADLLVYTSSGAGTWGPPMRVGTQPEIVLIEFK